MMKPLALATIAAATLATGALAQQTTPGRMEVGTLSCRMTDRTNLIVVSETKFDCEFVPSDGRPREAFDGTVRKVGADLTLKAEEVLVWGVLAPTMDADFAAMEGAYVGASAEVAVVAGVGASVLFGGGDKAFALQPISVSGSVGVGAALAIEGMRLDYKGRVR